MRIAVCSHDTDERYLISRLTDEAMLQQGRLPKISLFPIAQELLEISARQTEPFDMILLSGHRDETLLNRLCKMASVILIGDQSLCPTAFDAGAAYFIESPVDKHKLDRAVEHLIRRKHKQEASPHISGFCG